MKNLLLRINDKIYMTCIWVAGLSVLAISLMIPWGVFARYVLGTGSSWPEPTAILLMLVFTYGMTSNIDNVGVVIVDEDQSAASREYTQRFLSTRHFKQVEVTHAPTRADAALAAYQARLLIWVGSGFERQLQNGQTVKVSVQIDGAFTEPGRMPSDRTGPAAVNRSVVAYVGYRGPSWQ